MCAVVIEMSLKSPRKGPSKSLNSNVSEEWYHVFTVQSEADKEPV